MQKYLNGIMYLLVCVHLRTDQLKVGKKIISIMYLACRHLLASLTKLSADQTN